MVIHFCINYVSLSCIIFHFVLMTYSKYHLIYQYITSLFSLGHKLLGQQEVNYTSTNTTHEEQYYTTYKIATF